MRIPVCFPVAGHFIRSQGCAEWALVLDCETERVYRLEEDR